MARLVAACEVNTRVVGDTTFIDISTLLFLRVSRVKFKAWVTATLKAAYEVRTSISTSTILDQTLVDIFAGCVARGLVAIKTVAEIRTSCVDADLLTATILYQTLIDIDTSSAIDQHVSFRACTVIATNSVMALVIATTIRGFFKLLALVDIFATDIFK
jgi:hypothetical protein